MSGILTDATEPVLSKSTFTISVSAAAPPGTSS